MRSGVRGRGREGAEADGDTGRDRFGACGSGG